MNRLENQITTALDAHEFLIGNWTTKPAEIGFGYEAEDLKGYRKGDLLELAQMIAREIDGQREKKKAKL